MYTPAERHRAAEKAAIRDGPVRTAARAAKTTRRARIAVREPQTTPRARAAPQARHSASAVHSHATNDVARQDRRRHGTETTHRAKNRLKPPLRTSRHARIVPDTPKMSRSDEAN